MVRDYMESGIVTSYKNKGIIIPKLISLPFFFRSSNICLKNCFSDKFSLRTFIFPHAKFLKTRNLHPLWLQTKCNVLYWLRNDSMYTKGFHCNIYLWSTMYNHYTNSHICCLWLEKDPIWFLGTKVNLYLELCIVSMYWNSPILWYTMMIPSLMLPMT